MAAKASKAESLISARGVSLSRNGRRLLDHVDLDVKSGEIVTLIGPNGAGKTTLVRVLLGLIPPDEGEIVTAKGLKIGYLPQRFERDATIPLTVSRFLTLSSSASNGEIAEVLGEVGASSLADAQVANLSGGEFQRVALAKTLMGAPSLLVLDEPVQNVDYAGEAELYRLIGEIRARRGCGILLISHDLHIVLGESDRVICLNGHICCSGVPESVAQHPEYMRLFGPSAAEAYAVYAHHHDHVHGLSGAVSEREHNKAQAKGS
jgi:zinc transport system ATP-binding protein